MSYKWFWLIFCQLVTLTVGLLFIVSTLKPLWFESVIDYLEIRNSEKVLLEFRERSITQEKGKDNNSDYKFGLTEAAITAMPSVVHILSKQNNTLSTILYLSDLYDFGLIIYDKDYNKYYKLYTKYKPEVYICYENKIFRNMENPSDMIKIDFMEDLSGLSNMLNMDIKDIHIYKKYLKRLKFTIYKKIFFYNVYIYGKYFS